MCGVWCGVRRAVLRGEWCAMCGTPVSVSRTMYIDSVLCTMYGEKCTLYSEHCTVNSVHCIAYISFCTVYTIHKPEYITKL